MRKSNQNAVDSGRMTPKQMYNLACDLYADAARMANLQGRAGLDVRATYRPSFDAKGNELPVKTQLLLYFIDQERNVWDTLVLSPGVTIYNGNWMPGAWTSQDENRPPDFASFDQTRVILLKAYQFVEDQIKTALIELKTKTPEPITGAEDPEQLFVENQ